MYRVIFLSAFLAVLMVVVATVARALWRAWRDLAARRAEHIRWMSDFQDLLAAERACRHQLTGEKLGRVCPHAFDCRACETHGQLPLPEPRGGEVEMAGVRLPLDRLYHRGHTWVQPQPDGTALVGLDALARRVVGAPEEVELPAPGTRLEVNGTACKLVRRGIPVRVLSPVEGEVVSVSAGPDWMLRVRARPDLRHLLRGSEVRPWLSRELEKLQGNTLADGGNVLEDLGAACSRADFDALVGRVFLEP